MQLRISNSQISIQIMMEIIKYLIIAGLILIITYFTRKAAKKDPIENNLGDSVYSLPKLYGIIGIISVSISFIVIIASLIEFTLENLTTKLFLILLFGGLGLPLILMTWVNKVIIDPTEIIQRNMWGKIKTIKLKEIQKIKFNNILSELVINDENNKIRCHENLIGFNDLVSRLSRSTNISKKEMGIKN